MGCPLGEGQPVIVKATSWGCTRQGFVFQSAAAVGLLWNGIGRMAPVNAAYQLRCRGVGAADMHSSGREPGEEGLFSYCSVKDWRHGGCCCYKWADTYQLVQRSVDKGHRGATCWVDCARLGIWGQGVWTIAAGRAVQDRCNLGPWGQCPFTHAAGGLPCVPFSLAG